MSGKRTFVTIISDDDSSEGPPSKRLRRSRSISPSYTEPHESESSSSDFVDSASSGSDDDDIKFVSLKSLQHEAANLIQERQQRQALREEQNAAYQRSLRKDTKKRLRQEQQEQQKLIKQYVRRENIAYLEQKRSELLPKFESDDQRTKIHFRFRFPGGQQTQCAIPNDILIDDLIWWCLCQALPEMGGKHDLVDPEHFALVVNHPHKRTFVLGQHPNTTLADLHLEGSRIAAFCSVR